MGLYLIIFLRCNDSAMADYKLGREDLLELFREQLEFLEWSAESFDSGFEGEAKRMATAIRVLVHDTRVSHSVLTQLEVKSSIKYLDTAEPINPKNLATTPGLVIFRMGSEGASYVAPLSDRHLEPSVKRFDEWWTEPVTKDEHLALFSRRNYVLTLSNKEGGAHVDPTLDASYAALTRGNSLGWVHSTSESGEHLPLGSPALASVRQIAHELILSLKAQLTPLLSADEDPAGVDISPAFLHNLGRNETCLCGSGLKAKKCHLA